MTTTKEDLERARIEGEIAGIRWARSINTDWGISMLIERIRRDPIMRRRLPAARVLPANAQMASKIDQLRAQLRAMRPSDSDGDG